MIRRIIEAWYNWRQRGRHVYPIFLVGSHPCRLPQGDSFWVRLPNRPGKFYINAQGRAWWRDATTASDRKV